MRWFYQGRDISWGYLGRLRLARYVCLPDHLRYSFESDNDFSRTNAFFPDWLYSGLHLCASTMGQVLSSAVELRRKSNFTIDMETNPSQSSERNAMLWCLWGTSRKKLLMISIEKGKDRENVPRRWYFHEGRKIPYSTDKAIWKKMVKLNHPWAERGTELFNAPKNTASGETKNILLSHQGEGKQNETIQASSKISQNGNTA